MGKEKPVGQIMGIDVYKASQEPFSGSTPLQLFTGEAEGAIPNGARVEKCNSDPDDSYADGTVGLVMASHRFEFGIGYYVEFLPRPGLPTFIAGDRIKEMPF